MSRFTNVYIYSTGTGVTPFVVDRMSNGLTKLYPYGSGLSDPLTGYWGGYGFRKYESYASTLETMVGYHVSLAWHGDGSDVIPTTLPTWDVTTTTVVPTGSIPAPTSAGPLYADNFFYDYDGRLWAYYSDINNLTGGYGKLTAAIWDGSSWSYPPQFVVPGEISSGISQQAAYIHDAQIPGKVAWTALGTRRDGLPMSPTGYNYGYTATRTYLRDVATGTDTLLFDAPTQSGFVGSDAPDGVERAQVIYDMGLMHNGNYLCGGHSNTRRNAPSGYWDQGDSTSSAVDWPNKNRLFMINPSGVFQGYYNPCALPIDSADPDLDEYFFNPNYMIVASLGSDHVGGFFCTFYDKRYYFDPDPDIMLYTLGIKFNPQKGTRSHAYYVSTANSSYEKQTRAGFLLEEPLNNQGISPPLRKIQSGTGLRHVQQSPYKQSGLRRGAGYS